MVQFRKEINQKTPESAKTRVSYWNYNIDFEYYYYYYCS